MRSTVSLKTVEKRLVIVFLFFLIVSLILEIKLISVQAFQGKKFRYYAKKQRIRTLEIPAIRGKITDRNGEILANSIPVKSVYATPYLIKNPASTAKKLSSVLNIDYPEIHSKLLRKSGFVYIQRKIPVKLAEKIRKLKLDGIGFLDEIKREYPCDGVGAQLVGYTNIDNKGLGGVELNFDKILGGKAGELIVERDPHGRIIPGGVSKKRPSSRGKDIRLTIDQPTQFVAQSKLDDAVKKFKAVNGSVIVMDVNNGEILAMANSPSFNPNQSKNRIDLLKNKAISDIYEPGSTMKTVLAAGAIEDGVVSPGQAFYLRPTIQIGNKTIKEAHRTIAKTFTFSEIIQESSNIGAITVGLKMGKVKLHSWIDKFGLTKKTGIDLPAESSGFLPSVDDWSKTTIGNVPIGQGVTVSALQLLRAVSAMVNGGFLIKPKMLLEPNQKYDYLKREKVISPITSAELRKIFGLVVEKGTAELAKIPGYSVGGKTGTAQKAKVGGRGYESGKYIASFVGFFPVNKPKIATIVVLNEPKPIWGGVVAAPVFSDIGKFVAARLRISPE